MTTRTDRRYLARFTGAFADRTEYFPHEHPRQEGLPFLDHQKETNREILFALTQGNRKKISVVLPCGAGKTEVGLNAIGASQQAKRDLHRHGERRDLFIATEFLNARGAFERAQQFGLDVGKWFGGKRDLDHPIVVATIQALQINSQTRRKLQCYLPAGCIDLCVFDEGDQHLTPKRNHLRQELRPFIQIAFTATPEWPDGRTIEHPDAFGPAVKKMGMKEGILACINAVPYVYFFEAEIPEDQLRVQQGDYRQGDLDASVRHAELHLAIPKAYRRIVNTPQLRKHCPTLIYVPSVDMVHATLKSMLEEFGDEVAIAGLAGPFITSTNQGDFVDGFRHGEIQVGILCQRGGRSMNLENAALLIDAYPTLSLNRLTQRHGRVMRKIHPGTELWDMGMRKEKTIIAQIVPKSRTRRPALFTDILGGYQEYLSLREKLGQRGGGAPEGDIVDLLRQNIEAGDPDHRLHLIKEIDALEAIKNPDVIYQENPDGFFHKPDRYGPHR